MQRKLHFSSRALVKVLSRTFFSPRAGLRSVSRISKEQKRNGKQYFADFYSIIFCHSSSLPFHLFFYRFMHYFFFLSFFLLFSSRRFANQNVKDFYTRLLFDFQNGKFAKKTSLLGFYFFSFHRIFYVCIYSFLRKFLFIVFSESKKESKKDESCRSARDNYYFYY